MEYVLSFLEGIITFVSPCLLPMLPIYISYFAGQELDDKKNRALVNSIGFVIGFTLLFMSLGAFAGSLGSFLMEYQNQVNIVSGALMVLFGLNFMDIIKIPFFNNVRQAGSGKIKTGFFPSIVFGIAFSISWTPCVGTFLGTALMMAAGTGDPIKGILMLMFFSLGIGIPFIISAVLIERLKGAFDFIKKNYATVKLFSGIALIVLGLLVATGSMNFIYSLI